MHLTSSDTNYTKSRMPGTIDKEDEEEKRKRSGRSASEARRRRIERSAPA
jgi:hypothetical protein